MGISLMKYRSNLRLDLKDSGALWSDPEINRCVQRAVEDMSRLIPLEEVYETSLNFTVSGESITSPATTNLTAVVSSQSIDVAGGSTLTIAGQPDFPRPLTLTITDANNSTYGATFIVRGSDKDGKTQEETFHYSRGASKTLTGKLYFKTVYEVELDEDAGSGAGDTLSIGYALFTVPWVNLANKPIEPETESVTNVAGTTTYTLDTDYEMDYVNGRIRLLSGGSMAAATAYLISYEKSPLGIDISTIIPVITKIVGVEYPVDLVPQTFVSYNIWNNFLYISSQKSGGSQARLSDGEHIAIYYERMHYAPGEYTPGSYPEFLDQVVCIGASGYLMLIKAYQYEHQTVTDLASVRTALGLESHTAITTAQDAANTTLDTIATLHTNITTALAAVATKLGLVDTYLTGGTAPSTLKYLTDGDAFLNTVNVGANVAENHSVYALRSTELSNALIAEANGYSTEVARRLEQIAQKVNEANGYLSEAMARQTELDKYTADADRYLAAANQNQLLSDRFRAEGNARLSEFFRILADRSEYRKRVSSVALRQNL